MNIFVADTQDFSDVESTGFEMIQQGPVSALMTLKNMGANTLTFRIQQSVAGTWTDIGALGTDYYNTLVADQVRTVSVSSAYPQVRLRGSASGGATLEFGVLRYYARPSGGQLPLLTF
jgi:hypothetical protein